MACKRLCEILPNQSIFALCQTDDVTWGVGGFKGQRDHTLSRVALSVDDEGCVLIEICLPGW